MPAIDQFILSNSEKSSEVPTTFEKKQYQVINDTNNNSYNSNAVKFETVGLSLCDTYLGYGEDAYMVIPVVITCSAPTAVDFSTSDFMMGFKNSHLCLIDKIIITSDGVSLVQQCANVAQLLIFDQHCNKSKDDQEIFKNFDGYYADDGAAYDYSAAASTSGIGLTNNRGTPVVLPSGGRAAHSDNFNEGFYQRMRRFSTKSSAKRANFTLKNAEELGGIDYIDNAAASGVKVYYATVNIKLSDLPFFKNFPLSKSTLLTIETYVNTGSFTVTKAATTGVLDMTSHNLNGCANPLMFSAGWVPISAQVSNEGTTADAATGDTDMPTLAEGGASAIYTACGSSNIPLNTTLTVSIGIVSAKALGVTYFHKQSICQLIVPSFKLTPQLEKSYISMGKKKHYWEDASNFLIPVPASGSFSQYVGSRPRMTRILICPFLEAGANNNIEPQKSCFTTEPATCSPCLGSLIRDFNIEIGGEMLFRTNVNYGPEMFLNQLEGCLNGNLSPGLTSGRFSVENWLGSYGYIVVNVRKSEINYNTDLRVKIQGTSQCNKAMQLSIFLCYEKSCDVNLITGQLENIIV